MRHLGVLSFLLVTVSTVGASAGNYVAQQNYNNPDVVVNMDVLELPGGNYVPVLQQPVPPLHPPMARPAQMRPPVMPPQPAPMPMEVTSAPPAMPAPVQSAPVPMTPPPMAAAPAPVMPPPIVQTAAPQPSSAPIWDKEKAAEPLPITPPQPMAAAPVVESVPAPIQPAPFSTEELAASAPPAPAAIPAPQVKKAETKPAAPKKEEKKVAETNYQEKPVVLDQKDKPVRELLAQAREKAGTEDHAERKVVLFDDVPSAPATESPLKEIEKETASTETLKPAALPEPIVPAPSQAKLASPITEETKIAEPMPIMPAAQTATEETAMLKPSALPEVAPSAIPDSSVVKKAETVVDDFEAYRLLFDRSSSELKPTEREILDNIISKLKRDENIKLQLRAYAAGTPDNTAQARRLSLARALAVRGYLTEQGITASRLDVRALGIGSTAMGDKAVRADIPADRVDMIFTR